MQVSKVRANSQGAQVANSGKPAKSVGLDKKEDKVEISQIPADSVNIKAPKRSLKAKTWGIALASFLIPGSGQLINGDMKKGLALLFPSTGLLLLMKTPNKRLENMFSSARLGLAIFSTINAVRNEKPDKE